MEEKCVFAENVRFDALLLRRAGDGG